MILYKRIHIIFIIIIIHALNSCTKMKQAKEFPVSISLQEFEDVLNKDKNYKVIYIYDPYCDVCTYGYKKIEERLKNNFTLNNVSYYFITTRKISWIILNTNMQSIKKYENVYVYFINDVVKDSTNLITEKIAKDSKLLIREGVPQLLIVSPDNILLKQDQCNNIKPYDSYEILRENFDTIDFNIIKH